MSVSISFILTNKQAGGTLYIHLRHTNKKRKERYGTRAIDVVR